MDLWQAMGLTPVQGMLAVAGSALTAVVLGAGVFLRRARGERRTLLRLGDRP
jgi:hypothetical protein